MTYFELAATVSVVSVMSCGAAKRAGLRFGLLDVPNARSSHSRAVPRIGGLGIACAVAIGLLIVDSHFEQTPWLAALTLGGCITAAGGFIDDIRSLNPVTKLSVQVLAASLVVFTAHLGVPTFAGALSATVAILWIVAHTNVFNFMDGSDGLAAGVAAANGLTLACIATICGRQDVAMTATVIAVASAGFLVYNWHPASMFMGDVGSQFLGYAVAVLGLMLSEGDSEVMVAIVIAGSPFLVDSSLTLSRRMLAGERIWEAHRTHLYQRLLKIGVAPPRVAVIYQCWTGAAGLFAIASLLVGTNERLMLLSAYGVLTAIIVAGMLRVEAHARTRGVPAVALSSASALEGRSVAEPR